MENGTKSLVITREFDAPREKVWEAWTNPEKIKLWWGPHGYSAPVVNYDFRVGGKYLICMRGPAGPGGPIVDAWSGGEFKEIVPLEKIVVTDYFADEKGNKTSPETFGLPKEFPAESIVTETFTEQAGKTLVTITYPIPDDDKVREAMEKSGMKEGWAQQLDKLAEIVK